LAIEDERAGVDRPPLSEDLLEHVRDVAVAQDAETFAGREREGQPVDRAGANVEQLQHRRARRGHRGPRMRGRR
jgi:hypothetical protein